MKSKKMLSITLALTLITATGCSVDISKLPNEPLATEAEVVDYNTRQLAYKTIIERSGSELEYGYTLQNVDSELAKKLEDMATTIESEMGSPVYNSLTSHISEAQFHTFKSLIDDKILTPIEVSQVGTSRGYYFVDKRYRVSVRTTPGTPKMNTLQYMGINGAYKEDAFGNIYLDNKYVSDFSALLQKSDRKSDLLIDDSTDITSETKKATMSLDGTDIKPKDIAWGNTRRPKINSYLANQIIGTSVEDLAKMPELTQVYTPAPRAGVLSGNGIYIQGDKALKQYGYDVSKQQGTIYIRFVFKQHITEQDKVEFVNVYPMNFTLNETPEVDEDLLVPDFVSTEAQQLLDRANRVVANRDLSGLMSGQIYADIGEAVLVGYQGHYSYLNDYTTVLNGIVGRNQDHNSYLLRISTITEIAPKGGVDSCKYKYDGYAVMSQQGTEFIITDYLYTQLSTLREPSVNLDDTLIRQKASLNLAGTIDKNTRGEIENMLASMYKSMTGGGNSGLTRYLSSSKKDNAVGYRDCFSDDPSLLAPKDKSYIVSRMINWANRYGEDKYTIYTGFVSEWMGGNDSQAEFITQELIEYPHKKAGLYLQNYYLVSNYEDAFKVVEMKPLASKVISGDELDQVRQRIEKKEPFIIDNPDNLDTYAVNSTGTKNVAAQREMANKEPETTAGDETNTETGANAETNPDTGDQEPAETDTQAQ